MAHVLRAEPDAGREIISQAEVDLLLGVLLTASSRKADMAGSLAGPVPVENDPKQKSSSVRVCIDNASLVGPAAAKIAQPVTARVPGTSNARER